jgi:hypothetical protein
MNDTPPAVWVVCICGALIPVVLLGGTSVAAWRRLARSYPDSPFTAEATFPHVSGHIGGTYGSGENCFRVDVGLPGLRISTFSFLGWLLPPFLIPWSKITSCTLARHYFSPVGARFELAGWPEPFHLWVRLWRDEKFPEVVQTMWREHGARVSRPG